MDFFFGVTPRRDMYWRVTRCGVLLNCILTASRILVGTRPLLKVELLIIHDLLPVALL